MIKSCRMVCLVLTFLAGAAWAELPDPIAFAWAIEQGNVKKVRGWLDEGLNPEFMDNQLGSGLMIAAWYGNIELMQLFLERGANPRRANKNGEQPLQLATWNGHLDAVKWLLDHGAALNREGNHWAALHYAVFNGHNDLAAFLIKRGAEINARSPNGSTPLMMAAREGREDLTRVLLESGADPKLKSDWGDSALTMAMRYDHYRLGKMISSPEEFEIAVKAPKESFGTASRSASAPTEIEELLRKIREAEAEGRSSEELHKQLRLAVSKVRSIAAAQRFARRPMPLPYQPRSIVITAKRGNPGAERAQVMTTGKPPPSTSTKPPPGSSSIRITPVDQRAKQSEVAELMRQIRLNEAQGRPAEALRKQLSEAIETLN